MRRFLTLMLAIHWTMVFAILAIVCAVEPQAGFAAPLRLLGADASGIEQDGGTQAATFFAIGFSTVAVLFLWAFAEMLFGLGKRGRGRQPDFHQAFAAAAIALTLLLLAGALHPVPGLFATIESLLAAGLASYVAMHAEWQARRDEPLGATGRRRDAARLMALGAAHDSLRPGMPGRKTGENPGRTR